MYIHVYACIYMYIHVYACIYMYMHVYTLMLIFLATGPVLFFQLVAQIVFTAFAE